LEETLQEEARRLDAQAKRLAAAERRRQFPLFGVFCAVKDNIDVKGFPTTAGCPGYAYTPKVSAPVVAKLQEAGAIVVGKTNLDQFATGLVGVRSPYGACPNPFDPAYISGGSSSGSAHAVAAGMVSFALGTDTAGSNRVPAGFCNVVGLKPTRGVLSTEGVVPAMRTLDCVGIFALDCDDAAQVQRVLAGPFLLGGRDAGKGDLRSEWRGEPFVFGVPEHLEFFGDKASAALFRQAVERLKDLGGTECRVSFDLFREVADALYAGPCVAERYEAVGEFLEGDHDGVDPTVKGIVLGGKRFTAVDLYRCHKRLEELRRTIGRMWRDLDIDLLLVPTAPTIYTIEQVRADPLALNGKLGWYTNFVNLLDMAGVAVPSGFTPRRLPFGVTMLVRALGERWLLPLAKEFHDAAGLPMGTAGREACEETAMDGRDEAKDKVKDKDGDEESMEIVVVGAHMRGLALNGQLLELGGVFSCACRTAPVYRMYALPGKPLRPALLRTEDGTGRSVEAEVWKLPRRNIGAFLAMINPPLGLGTLTLEDGRQVKGFISEAYPLASATDITALGGFRAYLATLPQEG
jgi:allophanate hydrolase